MDNIEKIGTFGGCSWNLNDAGTLTLSPSNGIVGEIPDLLGPTAASIPWGPIKDEVKSVVVEHGVTLDKNAISLFADLKNCKEMDLSGLDTSRTECVAGMFRGCESLEKLDLSNFDASKMTDFNHMCAGDKSLQEIKMPTNTNSLVESIGSAFNNCQKLESLDLSGMHFANSPWVYEAFHNCYDLKDLKINSQEMAQAVGRENMLLGCMSMPVQDVKNIETDMAKAVKTWEPPKAKEMTKNRDNREMSH